jgi:hypothetical protein
MLKVYFVEKKNCFLKSFNSRIIMEAAEGLPGTDNFWFWKIQETHSSKFLMTFA